ncbi:hypothetical protein ACTHQN_16845 [Curtobacterium flaccumfaciens]|uniref:hypothetical protein n=1 Tax=Curtobacterium flaccumfaciens TaxID=2035 RepID=UPI003F7E2D4D
MTSQSREREPNAGGAEQHRGVLIAAAMLGAFGIALPLVLAGDHAFAAMPYSVLGGLAGFFAAGLSLRFLPVSSGTRIMIVALFIGLIVFSRMGGSWMLAVPPFILCSFGSACIGSHLRYRAWKARAERAA